MRLNLENLPEHIKARNPHLFAVGGVCSAKPEPPAGKALERPLQGLQGGTQGMEEGNRRLRVVLVVHRRRLVTDRDNLIGGCKHIRDVIARSFGIDDAERFIDWEYHQIKTRGRQGVAVKIETA